MTGPLIFVLAVIALMFGVVYYTWKHASVIGSDAAGVAQEQKPALEDDPVAQPIEWRGVSEWMPTPTSGALRIDTASNSLVRFRPRPMPKTLHVFIYMFTAVGAALVFFKLGSTLQAAATLAAGITTSSAIFAANRWFGGEFTFDNDAGVFWSRGNGVGKISEIYALQLISVYGTTGFQYETRTYNTYELNLVMKDGQRRNITSHDDLDGMFHDAAFLSSFLSKPLWQRL